jgi:hypothetical protein
MAVDNENGAVWPAAAIIQQQMVGFVAKHAETVTGPIFLGFGANEVSAPVVAHQHVAWYWGSKDVTLYVLPDSTHCYNFAGNRELLWGRLADWANRAAREGPPGRRLIGSASRSDTGYTGNSPRR